MSELEIKHALELMWEGVESVDIKTFVLPDLIPTVYGAVVNTHRMYFQDGHAYRVSHGYAKRQGKPVEYMETIYTPYRSDQDPMGEILSNDPAPHPERNR
jgi:exosome complex RNA-binding protein Rrp4